MMIALCVLIQKHTHFIFAKCGFLQPLSSDDVVQNLMVLNTRVGGPPQTECLPTGHSKWPLENRNCTLTAIWSWEEIQWGWL